MKLKMCLLFCCILSSSTMLGAAESAPIAPAQPVPSQTEVASEPVASQPVVTQVAPDYPQPQPPMQPQSRFLSVFSFLTFFFGVWLIPNAIICYCLAKGKGRNTTLWLILGFVPFVNLYALLYLVGAEDRDLKKRIQEIKQLLQK